MAPVAWLIRPGEGGELDAERRDLVDGSNARRISECAQDHPATTTLARGNVRLSLGRPPLIMP